MNTQLYHKLIVWQKADEYIKSVYFATTSFSNDEKYGLTSQLKRASTSIALNIVEGQARASSKDFIRFLINSRGSASECAYILELSFGLGYLSQDSFNKLNRQLRDVNYYLQQMINGLNRK